MPPATHEKAPAPGADGAAQNLVDGVQYGVQYDAQHGALLTDDDRAFRASLDGLIDFYRIEQASSLWRAFWPPAFVFLPLGSVLTSIAMTDRWVRGPMQPALVVLALLVTGCGPLWAIISLLRSIGRDDRYVAIFEEGLRIHLDGSQQLRCIAWDELEEVHCERTRLTLVGPGGELHITSKFAELSLSDLGRRIRHARRLALWGRLSRSALAHAG